MQTFLLRKILPMAHSWYCNKNVANPAHYPMDVANFSLGKDIHWQKIPCVQYECIKESMRLHTLEYGGVHLYVLTE